MNETAAATHVVVVYESMFGATRQIAETIADQLRPFATVAVVSSARVDVTELTQADLIVAGGPTHVFGLSSSTTRAEAQRMADDAADLAFEWPDIGVGLREVLATIPPPSRPTGFAAFSTRTAKASRLFTGSAARGIDRGLRHAGYLPFIPPQDFLVDKTHRLIDGQLAAAADWGGQLAGRLNLHREAQLDWHG